MWGEHQCFHPAELRAERERREASDYHNSTQQVTQLQMPPILWDKMWGFFTYVHPVQWQKRSFRLSGMWRHFQLKFRTRGSRSWTGDLYKQTFLKRDRCCPDGWTKWTITLFLHFSYLIAAQAYVITQIINIYQWKLCSIFLFFLYFFTEPCRQTVPKIAWQHFYDRSFEWKQQASGKMAGLVPREGGVGYSLTVYKNRACRFSKTVTHLLYMTPGYLYQNREINRIRVQGYAGLNVTGTFGNKNTMFFQ